MPLFIYCPKCEARFDITGCQDASRFLCDECGTEISVRFANLILMPGGIATEIKQMADGSRWLICPKCGRNANISNLSPGNRFRCRRCSLLLQVPSAAPQKPVPPPRSADEIIKCPGCRTRYDTSKYTPGNRFRCRRCGMTLNVPPKAAWRKTGEWEIDVDKSLIRCNRCGQSYPLGAVSKDDTFVCRKCRKVFSGINEPAARPERRDAPDEEWELDLDAGFITCPGCRYSYDISSLPADADFPCKHCDRVFRMPRELPRETQGDARENIACPRCGEVYDVSGYLRGTMFSCSRCEETVFLGVSGGISPRVEAEALAALKSDSSSKTRSFIPAELPPDPGAAPSAPEAPPAEPEALPAEPEEAGRAAEIPEGAPAAPGMDEEKPPSHAEPPETPGRAPKESQAAAPLPAPEPPPVPEKEPEVLAGPNPPEETAPETRPPSPAEPVQTRPKAEPVPMPGTEPAPGRKQPGSDRFRKAPEKEPEGRKKIPVPFPPLPPEQVLAKARHPDPETPGQDKPGAQQQAKPGAKTQVRLIVRCTVCGMRHDAGGMAEGDKITCKCGKKIKIKGPKKTAQKTGKDAVEEALDKRGVKSDDVEVL